MGNITARVEKTQEVVSRVTSGSTLSAVISKNRPVSSVVRTESDTVSSRTDSLPFMIVNRYNQENQMEPDDGSLRDFTTEYKFIVASLLVFINGVFQDKSKYTITGPQNIRFNFDILAHYEVSVIYQYYP